MNDGIYGSMMLSSRRFKTIKVDRRVDDDYTTFFYDIDDDDSEVDQKRSFSVVEEVFAERSFAILERFKNHSKSLIVSSFPFCSEPVFSRFLGASTEMEELTLFTEYKGFGPRKVRTYALSKEFSKLKRLSVPAVNEISELLEKVPNDALERFSAQRVFLRGFTLDGETLQGFLNRQKSLKKLTVDGIAWNINLENLALESLFFFYNRDFKDQKLATVLKNQTAMLDLECGAVGSLAFDEILKMEDLRVLKCHFAEDVVGGMRSLKKLDINYNCSVLRQLILPNLEELKVEEGSPDAEHFLALSRSARNLQHVEISCYEFNFLSVIIGNFPALKTLVARAGSSDDDFFHPAPSRPNQSLEELIIDKPLWAAPMEPVFETVKACPNLKRVQLHGLRFTGRQLLVLMQNLNHLTHFWFGSPFWNIFGESEGIDPALKEMINIFKNSPNFVYLAILGIWDWGEEESVEDLLEDDAERIIVEKPIKPRFGTCDVKLVKGANARESFKNLRE